MMSESKDTEITVSVCCTAFNHVKYIADALEGFVMQEVDFPIEILIHDDASTDGTQDVIREYEKRYPDLIKPIYQKTNQYSEGCCAFVHILYPMAKGKYIAFCDGDDFWTDPEKLKKQVDFLENNPEYAVCGHDAYVFNENGVQSFSKLPDVEKRDATSEQLQKGRFVLTMSACFRNVNVPIPDEYSYAFNGDTFLFSWLGQFGKYKYMGDIKPAAYRTHSGGLWSLLDNRQKTINVISTCYWLSQYYSRVGSHDMAFYFIVRSASIFLEELCLISLKRLLVLNFVVGRVWVKGRMPNFFKFLRSVRNRFVYKFP